MGRASVLLITLAAFCLTVGSAQRTPRATDECNPNVGECSFSLLEPLNTLSKGVEGTRSKTPVDVEELDLDFQPTLPGEYEFTLTSQDLCSELNHTTNVFVRCPPAPEAVITPISGITADGTVLQRTRVRLSSKGSKASPGPGGKIPQIKMEWKWVAKPDEETRPEFNVHSETNPNLLVTTTVNDVQTYESPELRVSGTYKIDLTVNDGCSTQTARYCFRVTCNCGPIAHAGATGTLWTTSANQNTNSASFSLDGSLSYDFDLAHEDPASTSKEVLSYSWNFMEWIPAGVQAYSMGRMPFGVTATDSRGQVAENVFENNFLPSSTRTWTTRDIGDGSGRGDFYIKLDEANGKLTKTYSFMKKESGTAGGANTISNQIGRAVQKEGTPTSTTSVYPAYIPNTEDFMVDAWPAGTAPVMTKPTTTSCMATVSRSKQTDTDEVEMEEISTVCGGKADTTITYCSIEIKQSSTDNPKASLSINPSWEGAKEVLTQDWHQSYGSYKSLEMCRGLWTFSLTVMDGCGTENQDVDTVQLTLRCNRPPVSIAGKKLHVVYKSQSNAFDQVTVDGRSSFDPDNNDVLTYFWRFLTYPKEHAAAGCKGRKNGHEACTQSYCQQVNTGNYATNPVTNSKAFGNKAAFAGLSAGFTDFPLPNENTTTGYGECGVTVYPQVYDMNAPTGCSSGVVERGNQCSYPILPPSEHHSGNSAYFRPLAPGTYTIQLAVFDGCSVTTDTVDIVAVCPDLFAVAAMTSASRDGSLATVFSASMAAVPVNGTITYAGDRTKLSYQWKAYGSADQTQTAPTHTFADPTSLSTTFTPEGSGQYYVFLSVADGCRTVDSQAVLYTVTCNQMPNSPGLTQSSTVGSVGPYMYSTTAPYAYPAVTITASSTDPNNDPVTFRWIVTENGVAVDAAAILQFPGSAGGNDSVIITPSFQSNNGTRNFQVQAFAKDACQENPQGGILNIPFSCEAMAQVGRGGATGAKVTPEGTQLAPVEVMYDFATDAYPANTIDGSTSAVVYSDTRRFDWCVSPMTTACTSNTTEKAAADANNVNAASFQWTPDPATPQAQDTLFQVTLRVEDGCSSSTALTYVMVGCTARPAANLKTASPIVEWDSNTRKFPTILLNASESSMARGATSMTYAFTSPTGLGDPSANGNSATYDPAAAGSIAFELTVANGPCRSVNTARVTVLAQCMVLRLSLKNGNTHGFNSSPRGGNRLTLAYNWDGTRFPTSCIDGMDTSYLTIGDGREVQGGVTGNFNALRYTWLVEKAPTCSSLVQFGEVLGTPSKPVETVVNTSTVTDRAGCAVTTKRFTRAVTTEKTITRTTLFNHHYNRPFTCFVPDVPGNYEVSLTAEDDCPLKDTASVSVTATCPPRTQPALRFSEGGPAVVFNGTQYTRVTLDARQTSVTDQRHTLTYSWTLEYAPRNTTGNPVFTPVTDREWMYTQYSNGAKSDHTTKNIGTIATFVPEKAGLYRITVCVNDGCPRCDGTKDLCEMRVVDVSCARQVQTLESTVQVGRRDGTGKFVASSTRTPEVIFDGNTGKFEDMFLITGKALRPCSLKSFRWSLTRRTCTSSANAAPPPPTISSACTHRCRWHVIEEPCTKGKGPVAGLEPSDRASKDGKGSFSLVGPDGNSGENCNSGETGQMHASSHTGTGLPAHNRNLTLLNPAANWGDSGWGAQGDTSLGCTNEQKTTTDSAGLGECTASFTCGQYGTYKLRMTVYDGCQAVHTYTTVTCRCETRPTVTLNTFTSMYTCKDDTKDDPNCKDNKTCKYGWKDLPLKVSVTSSMSPRLPNCPIPNRAQVPMPASAPRDRCCPTAPPCMACPRCPTCPACVTSGSVKKGIHNGVAYRYVPAPAAVPLGSRALLSIDETVENIMDVDVTETTASGVVAPIGAVLVISMLANILLYNKIQSRRAVRAQERKVLEATML